MMKIYSLEWFDDEDKVWHSQISRRDKKSLLEIYDGLAKDLNMSKRKWRIAIYRLSSAEMINEA